MGKTIEEYKKELESQITSFKNIHYALNSGSWQLEYDRHYHLTLVQWSDTLRQMLALSQKQIFRILLRLGRVVYIPKIKLFRFMNRS